MDEAAKVMGGMTKDPFYDLNNNEFKKYVDNTNIFFPKKHPPEVISFLGGCFIFSFMPHINT